MKKLMIVMLMALSLTACQQSMEQRAAQEAKNYTSKNCPTPVRDNINTDSLTFDEATKTLTYYYTMHNQLDSVEGIKAQETRLIDALQQGLRNAPGLKQYKEAGFNIRYVYRSKKDPSVVLLEKTFTKEDYQ